MIVIPYPYIFVTDICRTVANIGSAYMDWSAQTEQLRNSNHINPMMHTR